MKQRCIEPLHLITLIGCFFTIVAIGVQVWALNKGFIMSDEGWFSCLLKGRPTNLVTQFHLLFGGIFTTNLLAARVLAYVLKLVGALILSWGAYKYSLMTQKELPIKKEYLLFVFFAIFGQLTLGPISLNYTLLALVMAELSVGFLLLGLSSSRYYYIASGFFCALLFPVKVTALAVAPISLIVIIIMQRDWKWESISFYIIRLSDILCHCNCDSGCGY